MIMLNFGEWYTLTKIYQNNIIEYKVIAHRNAKQNSTWHYKENEITYQHFTSVNYICYVFPTTKKRSYLEIKL